MSRVDYEMAEIHAKLLREAIETKQPFNEHTFANFTTSIVSMLLDGEPLGPEATAFYHDLKAMYTYDRADKELKDFSLGAVYGSLKFLEICKRLQKEST
jgi:hypothetical protein